MARLLGHVDGPEASLPPVPVAPAAPAAAGDPIGPVARMFHFVASAAPGVREIVTVGKRCRQVCERHDDMVVVDAVSSGHIIGPAGRPSGHQPSGAGRAGTPANGLDARHPFRPGHHRGAGGGHARGDAGNGDDRARRAAGERATVALAGIVVTGSCPALVTREEQAFEARGTPQAEDSLGDCARWPARALLEAAGADGGGHGWFIVPAISSDCGSPPGRISRQGRRRSTCRTLFLRSYGLRAHSPA